jgi:hypothetical protein
MTVATITVRIIGLAGCDSEHRAELPATAVPMLQFITAQSDSPAPWSTLAQAMISLAILGATVYLTDFSKRSLKDTLAALMPKPPKDERQ